MVKKLDVVLDTEEMGIIYKGPKGGFIVECYDMDGTDIVYASTYKEALECLGIEDDEE